MKNTNYIIGGVIVILIILSIVLGQREKVPTDNPLTVDNIVNEGRSCYLYEELVERDSEISMYDREYIELIVDADGMVNGTHNIIPAKTDTNRAKLIGVTDGEYVNVIATASSEGMQWDEQRVYKIIDGNLYVGYQPVFVPRYQGNNEVFFYEDINQLVFDTEEFFLEKVECDSVEIDVRQ